MKVTLRYTLHILFVLLKLHNIAKTFAHVPAM